MKIQRDKLLHVGACGLPALVVAIVISVMSGGYICGAVAGVATGLAAGLGKEYGDRQCRHNRWDWMDVLADAVGSVAGTAVGALAGVL